MMVRLMDLVRRLTRPMRRLLMEVGGVWNCEHHPSIAIPRAIPGIAEWLLQGIADQKLRRRVVPCGWKLDVFDLQESIRKLPVSEEELREQGDDHPACIEGLT
jgi:hypothetical protein